MEMFLKGNKRNGEAGGGRSKRKLQNYRERERERERWRVRPNEESDKIKEKKRVGQFKAIFKKWFQSWQGRN